MNISKNYRLRKEIGQGTFGKVYLAEHLPTKAQIAIKILDKKKIKDQSDFERVCRELKISQTIDHPHLVQLYDMLETEQYIFLVMEYLGGGELYDHIVTHKKLSESDTFNYFSQIISSLEYLHTLNIVHRDLKPENLLLNISKKQIKLVDFGLGRFYDVNSKIDTACGSPCYAPPEMLAKFKYEPVKADIWSLGIVLYAMLSGFLPFDDDNQDKLYSKIIEGKFTVPEFVSADAKDLLLKIINKEPKLRIGMDEIVKHPWYLKHQKLAKEKGTFCCTKKHSNFYSIDFDVVNILKQKGFQEKAIMESIKKKNHSDLYCYYHILKNLKTQKKLTIPSKPRRNFKKKGGDSNKDKVMGSNAKNTDRKEVAKIAKPGFKRYSGPIDLDFLSLKSPLIIFQDLKRKLKAAKLRVESEDGIGLLNVYSKQRGVSFSLRVVYYVDFDQGSYVMFEKMKPNKDTFDRFYQDEISRVFQRVFN